MTAFLVKRWFLIVLLAGIAVAALSPRSLRWTDWVRPQPVMALALFLAAWTLESRSLYLSFLRPWPALWAVVVSYLFLPALGWLTGMLLSVVDFQIGLMICASVPCTLASAVLWTRMAGGNEATALLATFITTAMSWLATPAWLAWGTGREVQIDTAAMMTDLAVILVLPVGVGQLARAVSPLCWFATRFKPLLGVISRLLILVIMLKAAAAVSGQLSDRAAELGIVTILFTAVLCIGNHLLALFGGVWTGRLFGFDRPSRIAIAFAGSQKTLPVSLALLELYFKHYPLAVVPLLFYHAGQLIVDTFIADQWAASPSPRVASRGLPEDL
jgi:solute carrier family 10 (sodium/bile acid cotransporter), member 7